LVLDSEVHPDGISAVESYYTRANRVLNTFLNPNHITHQHQQVIENFWPFPSTWVLVSFYF